MTHTKAQHRRLPGRWHATWHRWRHSIRWRLLTLFLLLAAASTGVFIVGTQQVVRGAWLGYARPLSADYVDRLAAEIGSPPDAARARALAERLPISVRIDGPQVQFDSMAGRRRDAWRTQPWDPDHASFGSLLTRTTADGHRIVFGPGEPAGHRAPRIFGWVSLAVLMALTALAYAAVRHLLRPLDDIGRGAQAYGRGEFGSPIPLRRDDELGDLARRINEMAANLHGMLEAKRALLLAISHELRSPLTRARLHAELLDEGPSRGALLTDLGEMRDLIDDLLEGERLSVGHAALHPERLALQTWLPQTLAGIGGEPAVACELPEQPLTIDADPARLRLLLRNLVRNAQRHGRADDGRVPVLSLRRAGAGVELSLRDFGPGVAPEHLARLAEPFYRPDAARQRQTGGTGLGLHLCRLVARAHGGELRIARAEPGLCVTVELPG